MPLQVAGTTFSTLARWRQPRVRPPTHAWREAIPPPRVAGRAPSSHRWLRRPDRTGRRTRRGALRRAAPARRSGPGRPRDGSARERGCSPGWAGATRRSGSGAGRGSRRRRGRRRGRLGGRRRGRRLGGGGKLGGGGRARGRCRPSRRHGRRRIGRGRGGRAGRRRSLGGGATGRRCARSTDRDRRPGGGGRSRRAEHLALSPGRELARAEKKECDDEERQRAVAHQRPARVVLAAAEPGDDCRMRRPHPHRLDARQDRRGAERCSLASPAPRGRGSGGRPGAAGRRWRRDAPRSAHPVRGARASAPPGSAAAPSARAWMPPRRAGWRRRRREGRPR